MLRRLLIRGQRIILIRMGKKADAGKSTPKSKATAPVPARPSALLDTRVIYCGDCLEQLKNLPDACVDLIYIDPAPVSEVELPFNSNRNGEAIGEVFWGETKEKRSFESRSKELRATRGFD